MKFSCFIIGTTLSHRVDKLIETMNSIDKQNFEFESKVLSLDDFGENIPIKVKNYAENNQWLIIIGEANGMVNNQIRALNCIHTDWVLYCEDDVLIEKLPTVDQLIELNDQIDNLGLVSLTGGGYEIEIAKPGHPRFSVEMEREVLDNIKNPNNHIIVGDDETFWYRNPKFNNGWFFEFPTLFIQKQIFENCINNSLRQFKGYQIEQSYTKSFFNLGYDKKFKRFTWVRNINHHLNFDKPTHELLSDICADLIYIKHNRNGLSPSVGSGYVV
jgi:hypothetical protein